MRQTCPNVLNGNSNASRWCKFARRSAQTRHVRCQALGGCTFRNGVGSVTFQPDWASVSVSLQGPGSCSFRGGVGTVTFGGSRSKSIRDAHPDALTSGKASDSAASWDSITQKLVAAAALPFALLVLPQVLQNVSNISAGRLATLSAVSPMAYATGTLGNSLMLTHFATVQEHNAVGLQLLGIASNLVVLSQVAYAGCTSWGVFAVVAALATLAVSISLGRLKGVLPAPPVHHGFSTWRAWQILAGIFCLASIPQVLWMTVRPDQPTLLPLAAAAMLVYSWLKYRLQSTPEKEHSTVADALPGWAATLMFALAPLPQLVRCFSDPNTLQGLSVGTMCLGLLGNCLMVPRALFTRDRVWLLGTTWATLAAGWAQLLSMFLGRDSVTGLRFLPGSTLVAISAVMVTYFAVVASINAGVKKQPSAFHSIGDVLFTA